MSTPYSLHSRPISSPPLLPNLPDGPDDDDGIDVCNILADMNGIANQSIDMAATIITKSSSPELLSPTSSTSSEQTDCAPTKTEKDGEKLCVLLVKALDLQPELSNNDRLQKHIKDGRLPKKMIGLKAADYNAEILRRSRADPK